MASRFFFCMGFLFFVSTSAFAAPESAGTKAPEDKKTEGEVVCTHQNDQRKLWIVVEGNGCKVNYLKGGQITVIGTQKSGTDFCERLVQKVKDKLIGLGFEC